MPTSQSRYYGLFFVMSAIWGITWVAIKVGVQHVPPLMFAGSRFVVAGLIMLIWLRVSGQRLSVRGNRRQIVMIALLMITLTYATLFWGAQYVATGLASVINLSLSPIILSLLSVAYGQERLRVTHLQVIALGVTGLLILFGPQIAFGGDGWEILGMLAIAFSTLAYCWGTVMGRPVFQQNAPLLMSAVNTLIGGATLVLISLLVEPAGLASLAALGEPKVLASWLMLVIFGSLVAFTIYLKLVRDWGAWRAGLYAFVSPVIAVASGSLLLGERLTLGFVVGAALLLAAAWIALKKTP
ncbi:MAG: EamA family transporter [Gammaproteobacteria bacterium]